MHTNGFAPLNPKEQALNLLDLSAFISMRTHYRVRTDES